MRISTKVECGIIAMIDIALNSKAGTPVTISDIALRHDISAKYLEQIIGPLRCAMLIHSVRGSNGGYILAKPSSDINFADILNALDPTILCDTTFSLSDKSKRYASVIQAMLWDNMTERLKYHTTSLTLANVLLHFNDESDYSEFMYYI